MFRQHAHRGGKPFKAVHAAGAAVQGHVQPVGGDEPGVFLQPVHTDELWAEGLMVLGIHGVHGAAVGIHAHKPFFFGSERGERIFRHKLPPWI